MFINGSEMYIWIRRYHVALLLLLGLLVSSGWAQDESTALLRAVELDIGASTTVMLHNGQEIRVAVRSVETTRDSVIGAIRSATVDVVVDGQMISLECGNYNLPRVTGDVQIDCPVVGAYLSNAQIDYWGIEKDVRLRLWPEGSPWVWPDTFTYPVRQRWFASTTWMSNEPVSARPNDKIYYHTGLDIGGVEGHVPVLAATDALVVVAGEEVLEGHRHPIDEVDTFMGSRYDVIYLRDFRGWYYRYSHLDDIQVEVGQRVRAGERIGILGKEGHSGGWSHLHFEVKSMQPSGQWGTQEGYAFLMQAYRDQYEPELLAVAQPHHRVLAGETVELDATRTWSRHRVKRYTWKFSDGQMATGSTVRRTYDKPGSYSEVLKVTDGAGNVDYDFARVRVHDRETGSSGPSIDANYYPTTGIEPGDPVIFSSRGEGGSGYDVYDFGDGSSSVRLPSNINSEPRAENGYAMTVHHFQEPGDYIVTVRRTDKETGWSAYHRLHVRVHERD